MEKKYVVPESRLIELLVAEMICVMNERDGVENWVGYNSSYDDIVKEFYPDRYPTPNIDMYECVRARLEAGEFQEELNLGELFQDYDLDIREDRYSSYGSY